jgi:hypothetical protein
MARPPPPPTNKELNEFKPGRFVIRSAPNTSPFNDLSAEQIKEKTNNVLQTIQLELDGKVAVIKGASKLPSNDIVFFTKTRAEAQILLENKHLWTEKADSSLVTQPNRYPVLLHGFPVIFQPNNAEHIQHLVIENNLDPSEIVGARWLKPPTDPEQKHGSILLFLLSKTIAEKVERSGLFFASEFIRGTHYKQSPK